MKEQENNISFLGTGWGFPPAFSKIKKGIIMTSEEEDITKSLEILLSTTLGERIMRPDYGCDLSDMIFEPLTSSLKSQISTLVETAILYHETRITLNSVSLEQDSEIEAIINITVDYTISASNSRNNFVYPFYNIK